LQAPIRRGRSLPEVIAYQGDGQNYPPSFKAPLNAGTEFELIERRPGWFHIKLADGSEGWISQTSAELI
jgi:SH3-like domain-containing protein